MKKLLVVSLLLSSAAAVAGFCTPCTQANMFPERFHFVKAYTHGAPVESVSTLCDCGETKYVAIAGYSNFDCNYPKSLRIYRIDLAAGNKLVEMDVDIPNPSDYLYSVDAICLPPSNIPSFAFAGCPDANGNVVWGYRFDSATNSFIQTVTWGANEVPKPAMMYSVALSPAFCGVNPDVQIAMAGKAVDGIARVYVGRIDRSGVPPFPVTTQRVIELQGGDQFKVAWLPEYAQTSHCTCDIPCTVLTVAGSPSTGEDCKRGNIHNFAVTCNGIVTEIVSSMPATPWADGGVLRLGGTEFENYKVRQVVWTTECCDKYPYPFLLSIGDRAIPGGFQSLVVVWYYIPQTGEFKLLATHTLPGKTFAGQFTPRCDCKSVTVGGGCFDMTVPCTPNIWNLTYDCATSYPTQMVEKTHTSFDDTITSLAFCPEVDCDSLIVTSESSGYSPSPLDPLCPIIPEKGEIGMYKVYFCKPVSTPCMPEPICLRSEIKDVPCRVR